MAASSGQGMPLAELLLGQLKPGWIQITRDKLRHRYGNNMPPEIENKAFLDHLLQTDAVACCKGSLPDPMAHNTLEGVYFVQLEEVLDVSKPVKERYGDAGNGKRHLNVHLTDGSRHYLALETHHIPELSADLPCGTKALLRGPIPIVRGALLLQHDSIVILGGHVQEVEAVRQRLRQLMAEQPTGRRGPQPSLEQFIQATMRKVVSEMEANRANGGNGVTHSGPAGPISPEQRAAGVPMPPQPSPAQLPMAAAPRMMPPPPQQAQQNGGMNTQMNGSISFGSGRVPPAGNAAARVPPAPQGMQFGGGDGGGSSLPSVQHQAGPGLSAAAPRPVVRATLLNDSDDDWDDDLNDTGAGNTAAQQQQAPAPPNGPEVVYIFDSPRNDNNSNDEPAEVIEIDQTQAEGVEGLGGNAAAAPAANPPIGYGRIVNSESPNEGPCPIDPSAAAVEDAPAAAVGVLESPRPGAGLDAVGQGENEELNNWYDVEMVPETELQAMEEDGQDEAARDGAAVAAEEEGMPPAAAGTPDEIEDSEDEGGVRRAIPYRNSGSGKKSGRSSGHSRHSMSPLAIRVPGATIERGLAPGSNKKRRSSGAGVSSEAAVAVADIDGRSTKSTKVLMHQAAALEFEGLGTSGQKAKVNLRSSFEQVTSVPAGGAVPAAAGGGVGGLQSIFQAPPDLDLEDALDAPLDLAQLRAGAVPRSMAPPAPAAAAAAATAPAAVPTYPAQLRNWGSQGPQPFVYLFDLHKHVQSASSAVFPVHAVLNVHLEMLQGQNIKEGTRDQIEINGLTVTLEDATGKLRVRISHQMLLDTLNWKLRENHIQLDRLEDFDAGKDKNLRRSHRRALQDTKMELKQHYGLAEVVVKTPGGFPELVQLLDGGFTSSQIEALRSRVV